MITISETGDHTLVAALNEEVQTLHAQWHPDLFKAYDQAEVTAAMKQMLQQDDYKAYVAYYNGMPAGSMVCYIREVEENAFRYHITTLYIDQLSVLEKFRGLGIGRLLLQHAEQLAKELGIHKLQLDHWNANAVAARFFRSNGYVLSKEHLSKIP